MILECSQVVASVAHRVLLLLCGQTATAAGAAAVGRPVFCRSADKTLLH